MRVCVQRRRWCVSQSVVSLTMNAREARQQVLRARRAEAARRRRQARQANPELRAREAAVKRQRRQADPELRAREAAARRRRRQADPGVRVREAEAKRKRRTLPDVSGADDRFKREFFDRLWFDDNGTEIANIHNVQSRANAIAVLQREFPADYAHGVLLRRCPCGQVLNACTASQAPGWVERREVSVQCGLEEMPPLPLLPETFPSAIRGGSIEEGASSGQGGRLSQGFPVLEDGKDSGTSKAVERRQYFQCPLCPYKTPRSDKLRCHRLSHSIEKPYKCEVCPAAYKYLNNYKSHMCIHTGEVPFRCDLCPFSTIYHMSLQLHRRTHSDAKPFACTMCPFKSRNKADLRIHIGNHRNNKPFKCKVCSFGYGRKWALKVHMQQQHKEA